MKDNSLRYKVVAVFLDKNGKGFPEANDDICNLYFYEIPLKGDIVCLEPDIHDAMADEDIMYLVPFPEESYPGHKRARYRFEVQQRYIHRAGGESWTCVFLKYIG